jgi:hypothetical protein
MRRGQQKVGTTGRFNPRQPGWVSSKAFTKTTVGDAKVALGREVLADMARSFAQWKSGLDHRLIGF